MRRTVNVDNMPATARGASMQPVGTGDRLAAPAGAAAAMGAAAQPTAPAAEPPTAWEEAAPMHPPDPAADQSLAGPELREGRDMRCSLRSTAEGTLDKTLASGRAS
eukprot:jgi/Tetstr1/458883/TSEL_004391.t1